MKRILVISGAGVLVGATYTVRMLSKGVSRYARRLVRIPGRTPGTAIATLKDRDALVVGFGDLLEFAGEALVLATRYKVTRSSHSAAPGLPTGDTH